MALRIDALGTFAKPTKTPQGFLRADATPTRCGVFTYRLGDGSIRKELRHPDEVFKADSLATLQNAPLTDNHPQGAVTADNAQSLSRGYVCDAAQAEGDHVRTAILITDSAQIKRAKSGKRELSCGYNCDHDETPGEYEGERYDAIQRNIVYNHVALVDAGRAGPSARLHLDAADAVQTQPPESMKITIDGIDFEVSEPCAQAFGKYDTAQKTAASGLQARADSAEAELQKAQAAVQVATDPAKIEAAVTERLALVQVADKAGVKCAGLSPNEIKRAVVAKYNPSLKLDGKDETYVATAFEYAITATPAAPAAPAPVVIDHKDAPANANSAREAHIERLKNAHKAKDSQ